MTSPSAAVVAAVTAVSIDAAERRRSWFQVLCDTHESVGAGGTWDAFTADLTTAAAAGGVADVVVTEFLLFMNANDPDPLATVGDLRAAGVDAIDNAYLAAEAAEFAVEPAVESYDERQWLAVLHELGARWDREESSWDGFRDWFRYETDQRGFGQPARQFVEYAESRDKAQTFDEYQVPRPAQAPAADVSAYPELTDGDSGEWVGYADELLRRAGY